MTAYDTLLKQLGAAEAAPAPRPHNQLMTAEEAFRRISPNLEQKEKTFTGKWRLCLYLEFAGNYHLNFARLAGSLAKNTGDGLAAQSFKQFVVGKEHITEAQKELELKDKHLHQQGQYLRVEALVKQQVEPEEVLETMATLAVWCCKRAIEVLEDMIQVREEERGLLSVFGDGDFIPHWKEAQCHIARAMMCVKEGYDGLNPNFDDLLN